MRRLLTTGESHDCIVVSNDGKEYKSHSLVLSQSPVLKAALKWDEMKFSGKTPQLEINYSSGFVIALREFFYTEDLSAINNMSYLAAKEIMAAADYYDIPKMFDAACKRASQLITESTVIDTIKTLGPKVKEDRLSPLKSAVSTFIVAEPSVMINAVNDLLHKSPELVRKSMDGNEDGDDESKLAAKRFKSDTTTAAVTSSAAAAATEPSGTNPATSL
jgi:hypothetical protein